MTSTIVSWKARREGPGGRAGRDALEERRERRSRVVDEEAVDAGEARTAGAPPAVAGGDLEVDRGLRLVLGDVAEAEQGGRRVEEPARPTRRAGR